MREGIERRIGELAVAFEKATRAALLARYPDWTSKGLALPAVTVDYGRRYVRLVRDGSAAGFIDLETGGILYAASWRGPKDKRPRANVFDEDLGLSCFGPYGVAALR